MMKIRFKSFASRLSIYTLTIVIVIFTVVIAIIYSYNRDEVTKRAIESTHGLLKNMATQIRNTLFVSNALLISTCVLTKGSNPTLEATYSS